MITLGYKSIGTLKISQHVIATLVIKPGSIQLYFTEDVRTYLLEFL